MTLRFDTATGADVAPLVDDLARLRGEVFRDWPYLYEADPDYERRYLSGYAQDGAIIVTAHEEDSLVGAATGMPLLQHEDNLSTALMDKFEALGRVFYCAESVLLAAYRGQGAGHRFFDLREQHALRLGFQHSVFCAVERPDDHPLRPADYHPLDPFWRARGYRPMDVCSTMAWPDLGAVGETEKPMRFWHRAL